jgi:hypothetical protein
MPKQPLPEDVRLAISRHLEAKHQLPFDDGEVGRRAVKRSLQVIWRPGADDEGPSFQCRRCRPGFDRYFVEVEAEAPSARILELIRDHFRRAHGTGLSTAEIYYRGNDVAEPAAIFLPLMPSLGAGIICKRCSQEGQRVFVTEPPYGDARRLLYLLQTQNRWAEVATLPTPEQAAYLEAVDRGLLQQRQLAEARQALRRSRMPTSTPPRDALARAIQLMLRARVEAGEPITPLIRRVERYSRERPAQLAALIAPQVYANRAATGMAPRELTKRVAAELGFASGRLPRLSERRLWALWTEAKSW